ncbi:MAG: class B sortase [Oscillospiraceae bacterium]|nr:class B sortase [Oscillospiraceae bacterium]
MKNIRVRSMSRHLIIIIMTAAICISGYNLWKMSERYVQEAQVKNSVAKYRPSYYLNALNDSESSKTAEITEVKSETQNNQFIIDLQNEINKDIVGWITIPNTNIDYPFVQSYDNSYYLRRDLYGNYALAGSIFMDYRCSKDFKDFNTIIYGHNMKNSSMFGNLTLFADDGFFDANRTGRIFLEKGTYILEFFAYMIVNSDDKIIYSNTPANMDEFFEYVKKNADNYKEFKINENYTDNINVVTLSTCSYNFNGARSVLLATIHPK